MRRELFLIGGLLLTLGGCVSSPKQTVLSLDTTDPRWTSHRCVAARKEVARYNDHELARTAVGLGVGVAATPLAGAGATLALSAAQDPRRAELNRRVRAACISDPLGERRARAERRERLARR
ncbi:MAG TPA: hypothetical protein VLI41_05365 [Phenylobacterium sp.]|uniref:hypothetical protein n=1 Tax=Phenylobacterium sp. TaxID=1871053 RepID=UPI002C4F5470|nr:hypothetical protein [Phenylobacterium sp.]HSV02616.1 hypothetical protein [Phenylobacterium sp.]